MSREITDDVAAQFAAKSLIPVLIGAAEFDSGTVRMWSGIGDLVWGGDTYLGAGTLLEIGEISETRGVEARGTSVTLSGIPSAMLSIALAEDYQDRPLKLWIGVLYPDKGTTLSDDSGSGLSDDGGDEIAEDSSFRGEAGPLLLLPDPVLIFSGRMDIMEISESGETARITITAENRLIDLRKVNERRYTPQDQRSVYPDDKGFDFVPLIQDAPLLWGRSS